MKTGQLLVIVTGALMALGGAVYVVENDMRVTQEREARERAARETAARVAAEGPCREATAHVSGFFGEPHFTCPNPKHTVNLEHTPNGIDIAVCHCPRDTQ